ncbi:hypothetical protein K435DRAFT_808748 [Dendrothele bispora CBS 962.96]|uniref:Alpha-type protein kinase domain-containing protein n=1 Tax=Dendrothele bispora (strain CBS 962.96) TaxID=1314807 RepID=A0A4S8L0C9_DENBC|nr:hypothetical protein K435DRAFT_808748 [Dendrothele bispora CBS 962.96]
MSSSQPLSSVPFTSDLKADTPFKCERSSCRTMIQAGSQFYLLASSTVEGKVRKVCPSCNVHYQNLATALRTSHRIERMPTSYPTSSGQYQQLPDPQRVAGLVNASHHKNTYKNNQQKVTALGPQSDGPDINIRSRGPGPVPHLLARPRADGYSANHVFYPAERSRFQNKAYAPSGDVVSVHVSIFHGVLGTNQMVELNALTDTFKDFDAHSSIKEIRSKVIALAAYKLQQYTQEIGLSFKFDTSKGTIGVDLDGPTVLSYNAENLYLLTHGTWEEKKNQRQWKKPAKGGEEWEKYEDAYDEFQKTSTLEKFGTLERSFTSFEPLENSKRPRSESMETPTTPPQVKRSVTWTSPPKTQVISALLAGGQSVPSENVVSWETFWGPNGQLKYIPNQNIVPGICTVSVDLRSGHELGVGGFKTAHSADITLVLSPQICVQYPGIEHLICVVPDIQENRSWTKSLLNPMFTIGPTYYSICAINILNIFKTVLAYWPSPPGEIYHMRYVNAGVCIVGKGVDLKRLDGVPPDRAFIIEELITPPEGGKFVKWIHNADPKPAVPSGHPEYAKAQFLSALQHLQYEKTHRNAYVSDLQGCGLFLTDGQIMTSPSLVEGSLTVLFGDGNVPDAFQSFAGKHACNDWGHLVILG